MPRVLAVGDDYGGSRAFDRLLADMPLLGDNTIIILGESVVRSRDSKGVLDCEADVNCTGRLAGRRRAGFP